MGCLGVPKGPLWPTTGFDVTYSQLEVSFGDYKCPVEALSSLVLGNLIWIEIIHAYILGSLYCISSYGPLKWPVVLAAQSCILSHIALYPFPLCLIPPFLSAFVSIAIYSIFHS